MITYAFQTTCLHFQNHSDFPNRAVETRTACLFKQKPVLVEDTGRIWQVNGGKGSSSNVAANFRQTRHDHLPLFGPRALQQLHAFLMPKVRGRVERRPALDVQSQRVRAGIQQDLRRLAVGT